MKKANRIEKILMQRDNITLAEARELFESAKARISDIISEGNEGLWAIEEVIEDELGLEPDYIDDFLFGVI